MFNYFPNIDSFNNVHRYIRKSLEDNFCSERGSTRILVPFGQGLRMTVSKLGIFCLRGHLDNVIILNIKACKREKIMKAREKIRLCHSLKSALSPHSSSDILTHPVGVHLRVFHVTLSLAPLSSRPTCSSAFLLFPMYLQGPLHILC